MNSITKIDLAQSELLKKDQQFVWHPYSSLSAPIPAYEVVSAKGVHLKLADGSIHTRDELADLAVDELVDITGQSEDDAKTLILKAREHWFAGQA